MRFGKVLVGTALLGLLVTACGASTPTATATPRPTSPPAVAPTGSTPMATVAPPMATPTRAPTPTATAAPVSAGELIYAAAAVGAAWTPHVRAADGSHIGIYDYIMDTKPEGAFNAASGLIQSWAVNGDSSVWTFKVRTDIPFHNGGTASATDLAFDLERGTDAKSQWSNGGALRATIGKVETPDDTTMVATLVSPSLFWGTSHMSRNRTVTSMPVAILSRKYITTVGDEASSKQPIGTGPYKFKQGIPDDRIVMEAVEYKHFSFGTPRTKTLTQLAIPESSTRVALMKTKGADLTFISGADVNGLRAAGLTIARRQNSQWALLYNAQFPAVIPNYGPNPLANKTVRYALFWYAIDRKVLVDNFLLGYGTPSMDYPVVRSDTLGHVAHPVPSYDPAKAKQLLAEAGFPKPEIDFWVGTQNALSVAPDIMEAIAAWWEGVGVKVNRRPATGAAFAAAINANYQNGWSKPTVQGMIFAGALSETSSTAIQLQSNVAAVYHINNDPEAQRLSAAVLAARTLDAYKVAAQAYSKYSYEQANSFVHLFEGDELYATSERVAKSWKLGRDSQTIRIEAAAALP